MKISLREMLRKKYRAGTLTPGASESQAGTPSRDSPKLVNNRRARAETASKVKAEPEITYEEDTVVGDILVPYLCIQDEYEVEEYFPEFMDVCRTYTLSKRNL